MLTRPSLDHDPRPPAPVRSHSSGQHYLHTQQSHRPNLPSRLSSVRSVTGPSHYVDLTGSNGVEVEQNREMWKRNRSQSGTGGVQEVIDLGDDGDEDRPRKKAKVEPEGIAVESPEQYDEDTREDEPDGAHSSFPGESMPPPPRPGNTKSKAGAGKRSVQDPARKAEGLTPPTMATRLPPPKRIADFDPWSGTHPEDVLNEQIVKGGYYDRPPGPSQNESNSARHSIWSNLSQKNNVALHTLSHLFTSVMDKRSNLGRCTAPSSFKPPPRVTVTDTKREAWLKDLANISIPLRRQSRTIPHGIRGKLLMEQCLAKDILLQRAVWLAKCVGANELRGFRRKGVAGAAAAQGESKWITDWTSSVTQFMGDVINACGQEEWQRKIDYAIKLSAAFYTEGLLDKCSYLEWINDSFSDANLERLPLWTLIVQIYWPDLISSGCRGRKMAKRILEHLSALDEMAQPIFQTLRDKLKKLVVSISVTDRGCLLVPEVWTKFKYLVKSIGSILPCHLQSTIANVEHRNERLSRPMMCTKENTRGSSLQLYTLLDNIGLNVVMEELMERCLEIVPNVNELVSALLGWSSTMYRRGHGRRTIATRVIAYLHNIGYDTDEAILDYLQRNKPIPVAEAENVWEVVSHLAREDCFGTGRYMQMLIATGVMSSSNKSDLATGLLTALPTEQLPLHVRNLRLTLLRRLGKDVDECAAIAAVKHEIENAILNSHMQYSDRTGALKSLSFSAKLAVDSWIIIPATSDGDCGSAGSFCVLRDVCERIRIFSTLESLVSLATASTDLQALASAADTLNRHALSFAISGSLATLFDKFVMQHMSLRQHLPLERAFLLALRRLAVHLPERAHVLKQLDDDLVACEQQHSAAACSPASDSLISMQAGNLESDADIDAVFNSGNTMDEQTMSRVFTRVIQRVGRDVTPPSAAQSRVCGWLNQLRSLDPLELDNLARDYAWEVFRKSQGQLAGAQGIVTLVASGCFDFDAIAKCLSAAVTPKSAATFLQLLYAPLPAYGLTGSEQYSLLTQRELFCADAMDKVAEFYRKASDESALPADAQWARDLGVHIMSHRPSAFLGAIMDNKEGPGSQEAFGRTCKAIIQSARSESPADTELDPCEVIHSAGALNVSVSVCWLRLFLADPGHAHHNDQVKNTLLEAFNRQSPVWPQLLSAAQPVTLAALHEWAREQLFSDTAASQASNDDTFRYCQLLDITYPDIADNDDSNVMALVTEKLRTSERNIGSLTTGGDDQQVKMQAVLRSLDVTLHVCTLYGRSVGFDSTSRQPRSQLLLALCALLVHPGLQLQQDMLEFIYDVAGLYSDRIKLDEPTYSAVRLAFPCHGDNKYITSLLGPPPSPDGWLALASRVQPALPTPAPSNIQQTAQQRVLARQPSQPQFVARAPGSAAQSRPAARSGQAQQPVEMKYAPYVLRMWEIMPDPTPMMGENDCSISLGLFGARKV